MPKPRTTPPIPKPKAAVPPAPKAAVPPVPKAAVPPAPAGGVDIIVPPAPVGGVDAIVPRLTKIVCTSISSLLNQARASVCPFNIHNFEEGSVQFTNTIIKYNEVRFEDNVLTDFTSLVLQNLSLRCAVKTFVSTFVFEPGVKSHGTITIFVSLSKRLTLSSNKAYSHQNIEPVFYVVSKSAFALRYILLDFNGTNDPIPSYFLTNINDITLNNIVPLNKKK